LSRVLETIVKRHPVATDMEEVVGPENMKSEALDTVIDLLNQLPLAAAELKHALFAWGHQTGTPVGAAQAGAMGTRKKRKV